MFETGNCISCPFGTGSEKDPNTRSNPDPDMAQIFQIIFEIEQKNDIDRNKVFFSSLVIFEVVIMYRFVTQVLADESWYRVPYFLKH